MMDSARRPARAAATPAPCHRQARPPCADL